MLDYGLMHEKQHTDTSVPLLAVRWCEDIKAVRPAAAVPPDYTDTWQTMSRKHIWAKVGKM
jgi:hypothetical protein